VPIRRFLEDSAFDPETIEIMSRTLVSACQVLGLRASDHAAMRRVALRIIELARGGERDPERLKQATLKSFTN
jgi:hypothetical protein